MFLEITRRRNPELLKTAIELHQGGQIGANTYVLDLDRIVENARLIKEEADRNQIELYMMTKQIGRNPLVAQSIAEVGIKKAVAVDPWEALMLTKHGIALGNVGHLVQIPSSMVGEIVSFNPEVLTVFSVEKAKEIAEEARKQGKTQDILLRVVDFSDAIYEGQAGGFTLQNLLQAAQEILTFSGVNIAGVTVFPCFLYDGQKQAVVGTPNSKTLIAGARLLEQELGLTLKQINAPSANSVTSLKFIKELGGTHGEPGHAFTGTIPLNAYEDQPETPALVYVSEVSHLFGEKAYTFGGGFYRRGHGQKAMVGSTYEAAMDNLLDISTISPENIDYYGELVLGSGKAVVGDTALYAFRTQIFVTRSEVAVVEGISSGQAKVVGLYDSLGNKLR